MGLLDFDNADARLGLGLLAAASARPDGAGLGQRLAEAVGSVDQWKAQQQMQKMREMQLQYQNALMLQHQQDMIAKQRANEIAVKKAQALPTIFSSGSAGAPALNVDSLLPPEMRTGMGYQPAVAPKSAGVDVQKALAAGYTPDEIEKLDKLRNVGLDEVARTIKGMQDGKEVEQQFDKFGRKIGSGITQYREPIKQDNGGTNDLLDPYTYSVLKSTQKSQSPDNVANNAVAWANNAVSRERLSLDKNQANKPQFHDGSWVTPPTAENPSGTAVQVPGFSKPLTEAQGNAVSFSMRAKNALDNLEKLNKSIGTFDYAASKVPGVGNYAMSDSGQQAMNAEKQFIAAVLRKESGAAISQGEYDSYGSQLFPRPGDSKETLKQKAQNREVALKAMEIQAGQSGKQQADSAMAGFKKPNTNGGWSIQKVE